MDQDQVYGGLMEDKQTHESNMERGHKEVVVLMYCPGMVYHLCMSHSSGGGGKEEGLDQ